MKGDHGARNLEASEWAGFHDKDGCKFQTLLIIRYWMQSISRNSWRLPLRISSPRLPGSGLRPSHIEMSMCRDAHDAGPRPCAVRDEDRSS